VLINVHVTTITRAIYKYSVQFVYCVC
jgi:hypothetical protein